MLFFAKDLENKKLFYLSHVSHISTESLASDSHFNVVLLQSVLTNESQLVLGNRRATVSVEVTNKAEWRCRLRAQVIDSPYT